MHSPYNYSPKISYNLSCLHTAKGGSRREQYNGEFNYPFKSILVITLHSIAVISCMSCTSNFQLSISILIYEERHPLRIQIVFKIFIKYKQVFEILIAYKRRLRSIHSVKKTFLRHSKRTKDLFEALITYNL